MSVLMTSNQMTLWKLLTVEDPAPVPFRSHHVLDQSQMCPSRKLPRDHLPGSALNTCDQGCLCPGSWHKTHLQLEYLPTLPIVGTRYTFSPICPLPTLAAGSTVPPYSSASVLLHPQPGTTAEWS